MLENRRGSSSYVRSEQRSPALLIPMIATDIACKGCAHSLMTFFATSPIMMSRSAG